MKNQGIEPVVRLDVLTVHHWRERFIVAYTRFKNKTELAEILGEKDPQFAGPIGVNRIGNLVRGLAGLEMTAAAVQIMEKERPATTEPKSRLGRQKLNQA